MTTPESENPQPRPLASYETSFWAFLEYPVFWIPVLGFTLLMLIALTVLMVTGVKS
jgi:hypothetical protein